MSKQEKLIKIAVVIPCYKVSKHILPLLAEIGAEVAQIYVVDDCCPEQTGKIVAEQVSDVRVKVLYHQHNQGVGGAVMTGYRQALEDQADIVVKLDGDGQMDPNLIKQFVKPIAEGRADYTKGNRFYAWQTLTTMPNFRLFGNAILSFVSKASSGYWNLMDPTNGYTAIHTKILPLLPLEKIERRYFFESDMLFRLNTIRAVVHEITMKASYQDEISNLSITKVCFEFPPKYVSRFFKRIFYNYFLRDFNPGSLQLVLGLILLGFGVTFGSYHWVIGLQENVARPTGTIILATLPTILGFQLLLAALNYDVGNVPKDPLQLMIRS